MSPPIITPPVPTVAKRGGIGFCGALFLLFLGLRLTDHIDWAWYWVGAPLWIPFGLALSPILIVAAGLLLIAGFSYPFAKFSSWRRKRRIREYHATGKWR